MREVSVKDNETPKLSNTRMDTETISAINFEIKIPTEINISQSTPTAEKEPPDYISNKANGNTTQETVLSPEVIMR